MAEFLKKREFFWSEFFSKCSKKSLARCVIYNGRLQRNIASEHALFLLAKSSKFKSQKLNENKPKVQATIFYCMLVFNANWGFSFFALESQVLLLNKELKIPLLF